MENYVANVIPHLQQWWPVIITLAYLVGVAFTVVAAVQAVSQKQRFNRSTAAWSFLAAVLLLNLPAVMDSVEESKTHETLKTSGEYDERARHAEEMAKRLAGFVNFDGAGNE